ncbi:phosphopyruvate hydratase [bacterium]|nr:MAG: phosphopyruvate hydratase [bacterium]
MSSIVYINARQILDSRGNPTIECEVGLESGIIVTSAVPSGASTGKREALELRDGGEQWHGKGVSKAVENVNEIIGPALEGLESSEQAYIDEFLIELDGTENKSKLGANAILSVSMAVAYGSATELMMPLFKYLGGVGAKLLPVPQMNVINGGAHADNNLEIQEFMIVPAGLDSYSEAYRAGSEIYHTLKKLLHQKNLSTSVGDEGGFAPNLQKHSDALELLMEAIEKSGYTPGEQIFLAVDCAASGFYEDGKYKFEGSMRTTDEMIEYYEKIIQQFPVVSIEDGLAEEDWDGWKKMTDRLGDRLQIVGDDIFVTNPQIIERGISEHTANAVLIKLNQIGTVSETMAAIEMAHRVGWNTVISHRSGETADTFIADLSVAVNSGQIKTGAPCRAERVEKYNQLLRIEEVLDEVAKYPRPKDLFPWL